MASIQEAATEERKGEAISAADVYAARKERFGAQRDRYNRTRYLAANLTVVSFVAIPVCLGVAIFGGPGVFYLLAALSLGGFVAAFGWQAREDAHFSASRRWPRSTTKGCCGSRATGRSCHCASRPSCLMIWRWPTTLTCWATPRCSTCLATFGTPAGQTTLQSWMLTPAAPDVIRARQEAVAELSPLLDFRDELATGGRHMDMTPAGLRGFLAWAEDAPWLTRRPLLIWLSRPAAAAVGRPDRGAVHWAARRTLVAGGDRCQPAFQRRRREAGRGVARRASRIARVSSVPTRACFAW